MRLDERVKSEACYQSNLKSWGGKGDYRLGKGRVLLIGEAAGLMDIFGEGIPAALKSGKEAAFALLESDDKPLLERYESRVNRLIKRLVRNWESLLK